MKKSFFLSIALFALWICSCATQPVKQAKDLSSSGIAYSNAVNNLINVTIDRVIDFDSQELKKSRYGSGAALKVNIHQKNKAVINLISELEQFRAQTKLLKTYFLNLQALADSSIKEDAGIAVQSLSHSISNLNETLEGKASLTAQQQKQIGALGGLVASSIHAAKIKRALSRDAQIIAKYLCYQENQLRSIGDVLKDRFQAENDLFLNEKVVSPYIDKTKKLGPIWQANRKQWFKTQFLSQQLDTAQQAAKQLRGIWSDILSGKTDLNSLRVLISDVNEFVTTIQALEAAGQPE